jgi:general secretion pathway protein J
MTRGRQRRRAEHGFTLFEALVAVALMGIILTALALITAQWFPSWNRGFRRVQQAELIGLGMERIAADLAAAQFVAPNAETKHPLFEGSELSVTFVRSAIGPNTAPGLEIIRFSETAGDGGLALVRMRAPFVPLQANVQVAAQVEFSDPVALIHPPYRLSFAYAGGDRAWQNTWMSATQLPSAVRLTLRSAATGQILMVSTAALVHVNASVECLDVKSAGECRDKTDKPDERIEQTL